MDFLRQLTPARWRKINRFGWRGALTCAALFGLPKAPQLLEMAYVVPFKWTWWGEWLLTQGFIVGLVIFFVSMWLGDLKFPRK